MAICISQPSVSYRFELFRSALHYTMVIFECDIFKLWEDPREGYGAYHEKEVYRVMWPALFDFAPNTEQSKEIFFYNFKKL